MNKQLIFPVLVMSFISLSCSSATSFEDDVKKMANYRCEMKKLLAMDPNDENAAEKASKLRKEMETFSEKMLEKYKDRIDDKEMEKEADKITEEVMKDCK